MSNLKLVIKCTQHKSDHFYRTLGAQSGGINYIHVIWQPLPPFASRTLSVQVGNQHSLKKNCSFPPPPSPWYLHSTSAPMQQMTTDAPHSRRLIQGVLLWQCCIPDHVLMIPLWYTESELPSFPRLTDTPRCGFLYFLDPPAHPWVLGALPLLLVSCSGRFHVLLSQAQDCYKNTVRGEMELYLPFEFSKDFKLIVEAMVPENKLTSQGAETSLWARRVWDLFKTTHSEGRKAS